MNTEIDRHMIRQTHSAAIPSIVLQRLPEDVSQAICHISSILGVNDDTTIEPGALQGMSRVLAHAKHAWEEMKAGNPPEAAMHAEVEDALFCPRPIFLK